MRIVRFSAVVLVLIGLRFEVGSAQDRETRDQRDVLAAAMEHLKGEIPAGAVMSIRSHENFSLVDRPELLVRGLATQAGRDLVEVRPMLEACGDKDDCDLGFSAFIVLTPAKIFANSAEVTVSWISGRTMGSGLRHGKAAILRLARRNNNWIVTERLPDEAFSIGPGRPKRDR